jgi:lipid-A-disaccharide synthase-like uncharacterized protein
MSVLKVIAEKKYILGIIITGLLTFILSFYDLRNSEGKTVYNPYMGILVLLIIIVGYIAPITKFRQIRFDLKDEFKNIKIDSLVFGLYCLSVVINLLLAFMSLELFGIGFFAGNKNTSVSVALFGMLIMLGSLIMLAYEMVHFDPQIISVKKSPKINPLLNDFLLMFYCSGSVALI